MRKFESLLKTNLTNAIDLGYLRPGLQNAKFIELFLDWKSVQKTGLLTTEYLYPDRLSFNYRDSIVIALSLTHSIVTNITLRNLYSGLVAPGIRLGSNFQELESKYPDELMLDDECFYTKGSRIAFRFDNDPFHSIDFSKAKICAVELTYKPN